MNLSPGSSSSLRPALVNTTNVFSTPTRRKDSVPLPPQRKAKRRASIVDHGLEKRVKLDFTERSEDESTDDASDNDSDVEMEDIALIRNKTRKTLPIRLSTQSMMALPGRSRRQDLSTRTILQSFVSSHKADVFKCQSTDENAYLTPPYACSYTHSAKAGGIPLLAVATEQGTVHILNTSQRKDWDFEPPRTVLQPHHNGIFDVKWNAEDSLLATCSGDKSTRVTCATTNTLIHALRGHTSTVKCVAWDSHHADLMATGGRDGLICIWDLRTGKPRSEDGLSLVSPVLTIIGAHEEVEKWRARKGKNVSTPKSITNLVYPDTEPYGLVSSGSFDGILRYWDLRLPTCSRKSRTGTPKTQTPIYSSPIDATMLHGSRRPRGIISLASGTGPTADLLFALAADSKVHTYSLPSLMPQMTGYSTHENMQTNSFYVGLAVSTCGRWLANGGTGTRGSAFLFDVANAARPPSMTSPRKGVELRGQLGEVGAVDWAEGMLATCADDGTVRVWRPDIEGYRGCVEHPKARKWEWSWSVEA